MINEKILVEMYNYPVNYFGGKYEFLYAMQLCLTVFYNQLLRPRWVIVKITLKPHSVVLCVYGVVCTMIISSNFSLLIVYQ